MKLVFRTLVAVPVLVLLTNGSLAAQTGTISGTVSDDSGAPLAGAVIEIEALFRSVLSDANGAYRLTGVPVGTHSLRVRSLGYQELRREVSVGPGQAVVENLTMLIAPIQLAPINAVVGSRARHTAADELAVPVDVFTSEDLVLQGTTETSQILQGLSPSINFPHQSVTDATDIVRPFTLRGLSPDHTLVLINGLRRHQTALVNTFAYGTGAGSSGVDLNSIPSAAIDRVEVLRDGASAQYGSDAIAGVVNLVLREGVFSPFVNVSAGRYVTDDYDDDGTAVNVSGGWGIGLGRGSVGLFAEFLDRQPTNRAWADPFEVAGTGVADSIDSETGQIIRKQNPVDQPNHHWGDGLEKDILTMANLRMPLSDARTSEIYAFGGYSFREGTGNGYRRYFDSGRNWPQIYPLGFLPEFNPDVTDYSGAAGFRALAGGWSVDAGVSYGHNDFEYNMRNTLNASLGPCLSFEGCTDPAPGPDGEVGTADDLVNQTSFFAGALEREEWGAGVNAATELDLGLPEPANLAVGASFRRESYQITQGETASWINGGHPDQFGDEAPGGSQVFPGFEPGDETDEDRTNFGVYADLETNLTPKFLANAAGRFESYSDFGEVITGKLALRYQPSRQLTLRAAGSTGFRAPGLSQVHFSKVVTNVIAGEFIEVGIFPVSDTASRLLGAVDLEEERSLNLSAGLAVSPRENLTLTADYFYVKIDDRILLGATFDDDATLDILADGGITTVGGVQYFTNGLDTKTQGLDLTAALQLPAGEAGVLNLTGVFNWTKNEITRVDSLPDVLRDRGSTEPGIIDSVTWIAIEDERPDIRWGITAEYSLGAFHTLGRASYFGGFESAQPGFCDLCRESYGDKTLFDAEVGYRFGQVDLSVGVRNLFDTYPDSPSSDVVVDDDGSTSKDFNDNFGTFPWAAASPFGYNGRYLYTRASIRLNW
ncbi:MAG: TonB-dependent receptor [Gemmatimonadota bacterium]|nr:MAG: TonB-dependent receptor [Gemmatimonadota bacterium]